jgi:hypothetical protein
MKYEKEAMLHCYMGRKYIDTDMQSLLRI